MMDTSSPKLGHKFRNNRIDYKEFIGGNRVSHDSSSDQHHSMLSERVCRAQTIVSNPRIF